MEHSDKLCLYSQKLDEAETNNQLQTLQLILIYFKAHIHTRCRFGDFGARCNFKIENFLSPQIAIACGSNKYLLF